MPKAKAAAGAKSTESSGSPPTGDPALRFKKMSEVIADRLRGRIARGEIAGGDLLPNERLLQEEYGVSRPTLREAMRILEAEGLLVTPRGGSKGARIIAPSPRQAARYAGLVLQVRGTTLAEVFALRTLVAPAAARLIAEAPVKPDLRPLRALLEQAGETASLRELTLIMSNFDRGLLELAGNEPLNLVGQIISHIIAQHLHTIPDSVEGASPQRLKLIAALPGRLERVLEVIEGGDADLAEDMMKALMRERERYQAERAGDRLNVVN